MNINYSSESKIECYHCNELLTYSINRNSLLCDYCYKFTNMKYFYFLEIVSDNFYTIVKNKSVIINNHNNILLCDYLQIDYGFIGLNKIIFPLIITNNTIHFDKMAGRVLKLV